MNLKKLPCHSFDVFDTLIGRWYYLPVAIFYEIEQVAKFKGFAKQRRLAGRQVQADNLTKIYQQFQNNTGCSDLDKHRLLKLELLYEKKRSFPISVNAAKVGKEDLAISDMYLSKPVIHYLMKKQQIHFDLDKLHVSSSGKWAQGKIYHQLKAHYKILSHTGDHYISDFYNAATANISARLFNPNFNGLERYLLHAGCVDIAMLSRVVRLSNPYNDSHCMQLWDYTVGVTLPMLVLYACRIHQVAQQNPYRYLLFSLRDSCLLFKVYKKLFPSCKNARLFYVSRGCFYQPSDSYLAYALPLLENSLLIDLVISGRSWDAFKIKYKLNFDGITLIANRYFFRVTRAYRKKHMNYHYVIKETSRKGLCCIERLNMDLQGTTIDYNQGAVQKPLEYSRKDVRVSHAAIDRACTLIEQGFYLDTEDKTKKQISKICYFLCHYGFHIQGPLHLHNMPQDNIKDNNSFKQHQKSSFAAVLASGCRGITYHLIEKNRMKRRLSKVLLDYHVTNIRYYNKKIKKQEQGKVKKYLKKVFAIHQ